MKTFLFAAAVFGIAVMLCYAYFYKREKQMLDSLAQMIHLANDGECQQHAITEEKLSSLEMEFKKFLDDSLLEKSSQKKQKEIIQGLISDIAHQTLTPITNLKIYSELLCEYAGENADIADTIREQTDRLDFLVQSLTALSRMETGIIEIRPQRTELQSLFDAARNAYEQKASAKKLSLTFRGTSLHASFDIKWTAEALGNILDNAIKYTSSGGAVTVSARAYTFFVRIDVADNGIGIAQEEQAKIFTRFYRSMEVSAQPGVGIGLYLAREIISAQHGYIKVQSRKNAGSVFSVFLPVGNAAS